jgi:DNA-binding GntR family transcriptional regulator
MAEPVGVCIALVRLEEDGLFKIVPAGSFYVKASTQRKVFEVIDVPGILAAHAPRIAAQLGVSRPNIDRVVACINAVDKVVS